MKKFVLLEHLVELEDQLLLHFLLTTVKGEGNIQGMICGHGEEFAIFLEVQLPLV